MVSPAMWLLVLLSFLLTQQSVWPAVLEVTVQPDRVVSVTSDKFVSVTLDTGIIIGKWEAFNPRSPVAVTLAKALYPAYLRVGGTTADSLIYQVGNSTTAIANSTITSADWDELNLFVKEANLSFIFGLNSLYRPGTAWDPANAIELMKYSADRGYRMDLELGNEPDIYSSQYNRKVDPQQLGRDFGTLRQLMDSMPAFRSRRLVGPDTTGDSNSFTQSYLQNFMKTGAEHINAMTFHHYYMNGHTAQPQDFVDPAKLDSFIYDMVSAQKILRNVSHGTQSFWVGETSTAYGGGAPGISNTFVAGFMWLDKLGLAAYYGAEVVMRQEFVGGNYGLVDYSDGVYSPNPDYWLTVLYKNLVGETVLSTGQTQEKLRVYCHCTSIRSGYGPGSITFYMMNLYNNSVGLSFSQFTGIDFHVYVLTSGDNSTLVTRMVNLNGKLLELISGELPPMPPAILTSTLVTLPPFSLAFLIVPDAGAAACMEK
ncbi:heparanase-like [Liolophura sinensis]|uniref:heparanase-like n=1 Tax=Liolophura sinensis TaxID=3198878 RepID=UPI003159700E